MSDPMILVLIVVLVLAFLYLRSRGQIAPAEAKSLVDKGALLLDVRSKAEYASDHLPGSINVPLDTLTTRLDDLGDRDQPIVVYCQSGMRSARAAGILRGQGFEAVHNVGGIHRYPRPK